MLSKRGLAREISNAGLAFSGSGDRRQMRITQDFIGGKQLLIRFRNNADLMSSWPLKDKTVTTQIAVSDDPVISRLPEVASEDLISHLSNDISTISNISSISDTSVSS